MSKIRSSVIFVLSAPVWLWAALPWAGLLGVPMSDMDLGMRFVARPAMLCSLVSLGILIHAAAASVQVRRSKLFFVTAIAAIGPWILHILWRILWVYTHR